MIPPQVIPMGAPNLPIVGSRTRRNDHHRLVATVGVTVSMVKPRPCSNENGGHRAAASQMNVENRLLAGPENAGDPARVGGGDELATAGAGHRLQQHAVGILAPDAAYPHGTVAALQHDAIAPADLSA